MRQYLDLVQHVLDNGTRKENRTGVDTKSTFGYYYEHDLKAGFPLLTTKKISWKNIVIELLWFLTGTNKKDFLERHGCGFWRPWYNADGTVNAAYGPAWRRFEHPSYYESDSGLSCMDGPCTGYFDQISWAVNRLKTKPMDRAIVVSAWQPHIATRPPSKNAYWAPCHCMWVLNVQNEEAWKLNLSKGHSLAKEPTKRLCLHLTQRSCDIALGVPYNLASYALLCSILARLAGLEPGIFGHTLVDAHVYTAKPDGSKSEFDHIPGLREQMTRELRPLPRLIIDDSIRELRDIEALLDSKVTTDEVMSKFIIDGYEPHSKIKFKVAV
jgi:thymidylate synthase